MVKTTNQMVIFWWISTSPGDESWNYGTQNITSFFLK